jgi:hypothetical protein
MMILPKELVDVGKKYKVKIVDAECDFVAPRKSYRLVLSHSAAYASTFNLSTATSSTFTLPPHVPDQALTIEAIPNSGEEL